jgi:hypothetical protein
MGMDFAGSSERSKLWSFCGSTVWNSGTAYESVLSNFGSSWLSRANFVERLPTEPELKNIAHSAKRVLVLWNDPSQESGDIILSGLTPLIRNKDHAVILHGISDGRFGTMPDYHGDGARMLALGDVWSWRMDLPRIVDFITRNKLQLLSPQRAFKSNIETDIHLFTELENSLGPLFSLSAGWHWFTLNENTMPIFVPRQRNAST